jgi:hypothetical protein
MGQVASPQVFRALDRDLTTGLVWGRTRSCPGYLRSFWRRRRRRTQALRFLTLPIKAASSVYLLLHEPSAERETWADARPGIYRDTA